MPYGYRHTYAQRHADAGVPIDVLAELLDHRSYSVTRRYYRIGEDRRRAAVDTVTALSFDRHGNRIWRDAQMLLESERARHAVGEVAVPYGTCTEPTNVKAGGGACPVRFRCAGCDHFRTNIAFLPDLQAYLDDLLRTRERLAAAIDGVDDWARVDATPTQEEITRIRRLISRIKGDIADLDEAERARIDEAVAIVRRHRAAHTVPLGMPDCSPHHTHHRGHRMTPTKSTRMTQHTTSNPADARRPPRRLDAPPPARLAALDQAAAADGDPVSTSAIARAAGVDRTFLYRHRDLLEKIHALQADPVPATTPAPRSPEPRCRPICSPPTNAPPGSTPASTNSRSGSPKHSANKPGASPGSAPQPTSTHSTSGSPISNSRSSTINNNSTNATKTSPPPAPPTANSWPDSTHQPGHDETASPTCTTPVAADSIPTSASELHKLRESRWRTGTEPWRTARRSRPP